MENIIIQKLMNTMVHAVNYESLATNVVNYFADLYDAELCTLWRRTIVGDDDKLVLSAAKGIRRLPGAPVQTYTIPRLKEEPILGITAWIAIEKSVCRANSYYQLTQDTTKPWIKAHRGVWDTKQFPGWNPKDQSSDPSKGFKNLLGLPIVYQKPDGEDHKVIAVLKIESSRSGFSQMDQEVAMGLMPFVAIALRTMEEREAHEQSRQRVLRELHRRPTETGPKHLQPSGGRTNSKNAARQDVLFMVS